MNLLTLVGCLVGSVVLVAVATLFAMYRRRQRTMRRLAVVVQESRLVDSGISLARAYLKTTADRFDHRQRCSRDHLRLEEDRAASNQLQEHRNRLASAVDETVRELTATMADLAKRFE